MEYTKKQLSRELVLDLDTAEFRQIVEHHSHNNVPLILPLNGRAEPGLICEIIQGRDSDAEQFVGSKLRIIREVTEDDFRKYYPHLQEWVNPSREKYCDVWFYEAICD